ncbi:SET domain-containing protein SmydA-8 [Culex quinquefasciatus]|uniref:SET domain-containing protein SmydA-8 n=1 Tax=Culex quinquefasciatus TaxID=7176 RepID=UPI0018E2C97F|nr:SET domain-containing protein SmydA-8 [Culex quinquefasciatus]
MVSLEICAVCGVPAGQRCGGCQQVSYCGKDHQRQHWKELHRKECRCYRLSTNATLGRHLVATRPIRSGEVIFRESPTVLGPKTASVPLCLGCHRNLDPITTDAGKKYYNCQHCGWPLCSPSCETSCYHRDECQLFASKSYRPQIRFDELVPSKKHSGYCAIVPLRAILLKRKEPARFAKLATLESHVETRQSTPLYAAVQSNLVPFVRDVLNLRNEVSVGQLMEIAGIFDTNSYEIRIPERGIKIRALYELGAMMAHCCQPNTKHFFDEELNLVMIAAVDIPKDEMISISYAQPLQATIQRRFTIKQAKCFECGCHRCSDPTEFRTYAGSIVCPQCSKSMVVAVNPLDFRSDWRCEDKKCSYRESAQQYITRNEAFRAEIGQLSCGAGPDGYECLLGRFQSTDVLHPWNTNVLQVKYALTQLYGGGGPGGINLKDLSEKQLRRKVELCVDLLEVANQLEPGMSPFRTKLLQDLHAALEAMKSISGNSFDSAPAIVVQHPGVSLKTHKFNGPGANARKHGKCKTTTSSPSTMKQQLENVEQELSIIMACDPTLRKTSKDLYT